MLVRRIRIENVRSFLDSAELLLDGPVTILIGPNGGGKTNLLDAVVVVLRRFLFASMYAVHVPTPEQPDRYEFRANDVLNQMILEKYTGFTSREQTVEVEVEVSEVDVNNMRAMKEDADRLTEMAGKKYTNLLLHRARDWKLDEITTGSRFSYRVVDGGLREPETEGARSFLQYLQMFEMDKKLRDEFDLASLSTPLVYLPVNRSASAFQSSVELAGFNDAETKRQNDGASSRTATSQIVSLAIGRLAQKYRLLLEKDNTLAETEFRKDENLTELTTLLNKLGYEWSLFTVNPLKNQYDVKLKKQGTSFNVGAASSGERELLTYLFAIYALNVRDALIIVDEPELHLHPKWQRILLQLFVQLSKSTGNQFLFATHSPTFVSPDSIQFVSRVFSKQQKSNVVRLNTTTLPEARHLLNIVNSQNNERLFFADKVVLVEGVSDRIFFEAVMDHLGRNDSSTIIEAIGVGGKGLFAAYTEVLVACQIEYSIIADLDYVEQVGGSELSALFEVDARDIKSDVVENIKSRDGTALIAAIQSAIDTGSWDHAKDVWNYIKSKRTRLRGNLTTDEEGRLSAFLDARSRENIHILRAGSLESYLPPDHTSKDLERLIRLTASSDFWERLPISGRAELEEIGRSVMRVSA